MEPETNGKGGQLYRLQRKDTWPGKTQEGAEEEAAASIMDIFIIGVASPRVRETRTATITTTTIQRSAWCLDLVGTWVQLVSSPGLLSSIRSLFVHINIDEKDEFIRERQVRPRLKTRKIYRDVLSRRQPFPNGSYMKWSWSCGLVSARTKRFISSMNELFVG